MRMPAIMTLLGPHPANDSSSHAHTRPDAGRDARPQPTNRRLGVLISGRGSNLQALIDAIADGRLDATIAVVIANQADAGGLERARRAGIETRHRRAIVAGRLATTTIARSSRSCARATCGWCASPASCESSARR